jgi:hypothetical protein
VKRRFCWKSNNRNSFFPFKVFFIKYVSFTLCNFRSSLWLFLHSPPVSFCSNTLSSLRLEQTSIQGLPKWYPNCKFQKLV